MTKSGQRNSVLAEAQSATRSVAKEVLTKQVPPSSSETAVKDLSEETSTSPFHHTTANQGRVETSGCSKAQVQSESESDSSNEGSNFDPSMDSSRSADGREFDKSYDSSYSATGSPLDVSEKLPSTRKSNEINVSVFREANRIHVRNGAATRFGA